MKSNFKFIVVPVIFLAGILIYGCTKDKTPAPVEPCDPNKIYFQNNIMPLINSNCAKSGCHDAITHEEDLNLSNYAGVMEIVHPGKPGNSELIEKINDPDPEEGMPPAPHPKLTQEQKDMLARWISDGALNTYCAQDTSNCSGANISYANEIASIVSANCLGCHNASTNNGGINLSTYQGVQSVAQSGKLFNAVAQNGGATPMPPNQKLQNCDIQKIKTWVNEGSKNN